MEVGDFKIDEVKPGETYFEINVVAVLVLQDQNKDKETERAVDEVLMPSMERLGQGNEIEVPFSFSSRGHQRKEAWDSCREKLDRVRESEIERSGLSLKAVSVEDKSIKELERDWAD